MRAIEAYAILFTMTLMLVQRMCAMGARDDARRDEALWVALVKRMVKP